MKIIKCDGCGTQADYEDARIPKGFAEVGVGIQSDNAGFSAHYDLCLYCEKSLRQKADVHRWVRAAPEDKRP